MRSSEWSWRARAARVGAALAVVAVVLATGSSADVRPAAGEDVAFGSTVGASAAQVGAPAVRLPSGGDLPFPVDPVPRCEILDNFGEARSGGRTHEGVDVLTTLGQRVYAVADGTLTQQFLATGPNSSLSGNAWRLTLPDRTYFFYAHLSAFADGLQVGDTVRRGDLLGYVGDTGNPGAGNYHLHFEYHPKGGVAVDPLPLLARPASCKVY